MSIKKHRRLALGILFGMTLLPLAAQAQRRSPLADAPAIRKRLELRDTRLEFGAGMATTLNQDFFHTVMATVKLGFHFTDWLSLSGFAGFAVANMATGFQERLSGGNGSLMPTDPPDPAPAREPSREDAANAMVKINQVLGAQLEFTPFTGKYSMFGKLFAHYDFYFFLGGGAMNMSSSGSLAPCGDTVLGQDGPYACGVSGLKPGGNVGLGMHTYFNEFIALNVELRDMITQTNPAGRDVDGDMQASNSDLSWGSTFMVGANVVIYLPSTAEISP